MGGAGRFLISEELKSSIVMVQSLLFTAQMRRGFGIEKAGIITKEVCQSYFSSVNGFRLTLYCELETVNLAR
jgi:hypothetical protein